MIDVAESISSPDVFVIVVDSRVYFVFEWSFFVERNVFEKDVVEDWVDLIHYFYFFVLLAILKVFIGICDVSGLSLVLSVIDFCF